jgi:hypothetical protein
MQKFYRHVELGRTLSARTNSAYRGTADDRRSRRVPLSNPLSVAHPFHISSHRLVAGAAVGGAAIQGLHAQAKPPAYIVIPILKTNDAAAFKAGVTDKVKPEDLKAAGGEWIIRNTKFTSLDGTPPEHW